MDSGEITKKITAALNKLPEDSSQIAVMLETMGIKGQQSSNCDCPISKYLSNEVGYPINTSSVAAYTYSPMTAVRLLGGVRYFIRNFDNGLYPNLDLNILPEEG